VPPPAYAPEAARNLFPLTGKPVLYVVNVGEGDTLAASGGGGTREESIPEAVAAHASATGAGVVSISARIEAELAELSGSDRAEFLESLGIESAGLDRLIRAGFHLLGLQTYFTAGEQEVRAWTIHRGDTAPRAAGVIHTDFERGFIKAETASYADFVANGGWKGVKEKGVMRQEGKDYVVQDGDVLLFRFNV
jgi:ribosome-binding ATPase YchF (GTP1/OBG family)